MNDRYIVSEYPDGTWGVWDMDTCVYVDSRTSCMNAYARAADLNAIELASVRQQVLSLKKQTG